MNLALSTCFVLVNDPDAALAFYRDTLGMEVRADVARDAMRWVTVGSPTQPDVSIVLTNHVNGSPQDSDAVAAMIAKGAFHGVHLRADDVDATFERLHDRGAEIVQEPADQPWGVRDGAVRDPSGNLIRIEQSRG